MNKSNYYFKIHISNTKKPKHKSFHYKIHSPIRVYRYATERAGRRNKYRLPKSQETHMNNNKCTKSLMWYNLSRSKKCTFPILEVAIKGSIEAQLLELLLSLSGEEDDLLCRSMQPISRQPRSIADEFLRALMNNQIGEIHKILLIYRSRKNRFTEILLKNKNKLNRCSKLRE